MRQVESPFLWRSCAASHTGSVREHNEDSYLDAPERGLWAVADGMGGLAGGDIASLNVVNALDRFEPRPTLPANVDWLEDSLLAVNRRLREQQGPMAQMGSTVALLHGFGGLAVLMWAGDSRVYRRRDGTLEQLTEDHSYVSELVRSGRVSRADADRHPGANIVSRAVGIEDRLDVDVDAVEVAPGDTFLLCTDGLYRDLDAAHLAERLAGDDPGPPCRRLLEDALEAGGDDNITLVVVKAIPR